MLRPASHTTVIAVQKAVTFHQKVQSRPHIRWQAQVKCEEAASWADVADMCRAHVRAISCEQFSPVYTSRR